MHDRKCSGGDARRETARHVIASLIVVVCSALPAPAATAADLYGRVYDTMRGELYPGARIELATPGLRHAVTDLAAQYWLRDIAPGSYLVRIFVPGQREVTGRLLVTGTAHTQVVNFDLARIDPPHEDDAY